MKQSPKYPAKFFRKFDVSPFDKNSIVKLAVFLSWTFNVLAYTSADFIPDYSYHKSQVKCYSNFTEKLSPVELPAINDIKFSRSEIGTLSSYNVIILPHEPLLIDRDRSPPFHII
jgi:hypothetical protein